MEYIPLFDYIYRTNDYFFEQIFGSEDAKEVLTDFLNVTLNRPSDDLIQYVTLEDKNEIEFDGYLDRVNRLDFAVTSQKGHTYLVQVQLGDFFFTDQRSLYYWTHMYYNQTQPGPYCSDLRPIVIIHILEDVWFNDDERYHHVFHIRDDETQQKLNDDLELHYLELSKIKHRKREPENALEEWLMYFNNTKGEALERIATRNPSIRKVIALEEKFKADAHKRYYYDMREKWNMDVRSNLKAARAEGVAKGEAIATIHQYLNTRFGKESEALQEIVDKYEFDLDTLTAIRNSIFTTNTLNETKAIIQNYMVSKRE